MYSGDLPDVLTEIPANLYMAQETEEIEDI
jgi:hypothetical protein